MGSIGGLFHLGVGGKAQWPTRVEDEHFKFGAQTGFYYGPNNPTTYVIPILISCEYESPTKSSLKTYAEFSLGFSITHSSLSGASVTNTDFAALLTPGVSFGRGGSLFVELPFGTMASSFTILPSLGMRL